MRIKPPSFPSHASIVAGSPGKCNKTVSSDGPQVMRIKPPSSPSHASVVAGSPSYCNRTVSLDGPQVMRIKPPSSPSHASVKGRVARLVQQAGELGWTSGEANQTALLS